MTTWSDSADATLLTEHRHSALRFEDIRTLNEGRKTGQKPGRL